MQDIPIGETQALAREATVPGPVVVKKSPGKTKRNNTYNQQCARRVGIQALL